MLLTDAWKKISELESKAAWLYGFYAEIFANIPDVCKLFKDLREEELIHYDQASFYRRLVERNQKRFSGITVELDGIDALIAEIDIHVRDGVFDVIDALNFSMYLEECAAEDQIRTVASKTDPELEKLSGLMGTGDSRHLEKVRAFRDLWIRNALPDA